MSVDAADRSDRELRFESHMSAAEAVMWKVSDDPWLRPVAGSVVVLDQLIDADLFRRRIAYAAASLPRLRERVAPASAPWAAPSWEPDPDFDLDYHLRHVRLAGAGSVTELQEVVSLWYEDPLDPHRPLWQFVVVDGLEGGRGALFCKLHHTISDGIGLLRLAERYLDLERDAPPPPEVDLRRVVSEAAAQSTRGGADRSDPALPEGLWQLPWHLARLAEGPATVLGRTAEQAAQAVRHPERILQAAERIVATMRDAAGQLDVDGKSNSSLWTDRSARRHLESVRVPLDALKRAGSVLGGSVNDVFVSGAVNAVVAYHEMHDAPLDVLTFTFIMSERRGNGVGGNFFTPVRTRLPISRVSIQERLAAVRDAMAARRETVLRGGSSLNTLASLAQFLPAAVLSQYGRAQVAGVDFATSNLRGAPIPLYIAGARVVHTTTLGPLAGTPFNLTTISYDGSLDMGLLVDPVAVEDPGELRRCLEDAYQALIRAGS